MMIDMHKRSVVGIYEDDQGLAPVSIHFSEWWNGEGMTFEFNDQKHISLHSDELQALCAIAFATGMADWKQCKKDANAIVEESGKREASIQAFIDKNKG